MPVDDLIGSYALVNGTTVWQDGPAVRAMRNGRALIINEVDQYSGEIRCFLHDVMDDMNVCGVTLPNGERVTPRPGYCVVCTTNALPSSLPDAIYDRFDLVLKADTLSIGLQKMLGDFVEPAKSVVGGGSTYEWQRPASVNLYIAAQKMRQKGVADTAIAEYLGLTGQTATDFLSVIAK
jgi:MoxR-like ATPase